ncbi:MAG TPA: hypothetical protein VJ843_05590 [Candidatus Saccharimonadales bacterium]|nr:hypothetical protein [Candidatus Saccharimonadales bacterium]
MTHELPQQHEEPYVPYNYDQDHGFSPLGADALMGEQQALQSAEELPVKLGAFTKAYVEHDSSKTEDEVAKVFHARKTGKLSPEGSDDLFKLEVNALTAVVGQRMSQEKMTKALAETREQLKGLNDYDRLKVESRFMDALTTDERDRPALFHFLRWKNASDPQNNMLLTEWLSTQPGEGGATDEQLRNVLQWNEHKFQEVNADEAEHLRLHEWAYEQGLEQAVQVGELDQALLDNFKNQPKPKVSIADPLSLSILGTHGFIQRDKYAGHVSGRSIVLEQGWRSKTFAHERTHILGRFFTDHDLNEAATDKLGKKIFEHSPLAKLDTYELFYDAEEQVLDSHMKPAAMNDVELSRLYAKRDTSGFEERLGLDSEK